MDKPCVCNQIGGPEPVGFSRGFRCPRRRDPRGRIRAASVGLNFIDVYYQGQTLHLVQSAVACRSQNPVEMTHPARFLRSCPRRSTTISNPRADLSPYVIQSRRLPTDEHSRDKLVKYSGAQIPQYEAGERSSSFRDRLTVWYLLHKTLRSKRPSVLVHAAGRRRGRARRH